MKLVAVTKYDKDLISKLKLFEKKANIELSFMDKIVEMTQETEPKKVESVELSDLVYYLKDDEINNLCYLKGNSDNRLIELEIVNLNKSHTKTNINFVEAATNYAFSVLNAETVTILSNEFCDANLISIGYESLGNYKGKNTYVKDRETQLELGAIKK